MLELLIRRPLVNSIFPGCRATRDGGAWGWYPGDAEISGPLGKIVDTIAAGETENERIMRRAEFTTKLKKAESGELVMFVKPEKWHDVRPLERAPQLLELRWKIREGSTSETNHFRLYFDEPPAEPAAMRGCHFAQKIGDDGEVSLNQNEDIDIAEKIRVEGVF